MSKITFKNINIQIVESKQVLNDLLRYNVVTGSRAESSKAKIVDLISKIEDSSISTWTHRIRNYYNELMAESHFLHTLMWKEGEGRGDHDEIYPPKPSYGRKI